MHGPLRACPSAIDDNGSASIAQPRCIRNRIYCSGNKRKSSWVTSVSRWVAWASGRLMRKKPGTRAGLTQWSPGLRHSSERGLPGTAKPGRISDNQVRRYRRARSGSPRFAYHLNYGLLVRGISPPEQLLAQAFDKRPAPRRANYTVEFAALQVQVETIEAHGIRLGFAPVGTGKRPLRTRRVTSHKKAAMLQPGVQVYGAVKSGEPMVGHHNELSMRYAPPHLTDCRVYGAVYVQQLRLVTAP